MIKVELPGRLISDKTYDSDPLDEKLVENGVKLITHSSFQSKEGEDPGWAKTPSEPEEWKVERLFARLQNFRHILVRFDCFVDNYIGFVHLGCSVILLRHYS